MKESMSRPYRLANKLTHIFDLEIKIDAALSVSMYYLNQFVDSERSSIFLFKTWNQELTVFSSLDLNRHEISIPKSYGVAGWVFTNRKPAIVNNAYEDRRFYKKVDEMTNFNTRNLICTPLLDCKDHCMGTLQSLNKTTGDFNADDLGLLILAASMVAVAINNSKLYDEIQVTNEARRKIINQLVGDMDTTILGVA